MASNSRIQQHLSNLIPSNNTALDQEMEEFKKEQTSAMLKALNANESPIKEKHLRTLLIGSFRLKNSESFWVTLRDVVPLHGNELVVWKIPILTHRLFFDGHPEYTRSSSSQRKWLNDLGNTWRHIGTGYGNLIHKYCGLLIKKIDLHNSHGNIIPSGNFMVKNDSPDIGDDFYIYEVCVDLFDYQDLLLDFSNSILETFDALKCNSVSSSAQCRLSPLITCINESHKIMEISTSFLAKIHKKLPPDSLEGHSSRYNDIYNGLKAFYDRCGMLTYFHGLVNVPSMPKNPPAFISSYASKEENQESSNDQQLALIDEPNPLKQEELKLFVILEELDRASQRCHDLEVALKEREMENSLLRAEVTRSEENLDRQKSDFIQSLEKYRSQQDEEKELLKQQLTESNKIDNKFEESNAKLMKLKDMYQKLRKEHIELLRKNAELQKSMSKNQDLSKQDVEKMRSKIYDFLRDTSLRKIICDNFEEEEDISSPLEECFKSFKDKLEETDTELENYREKNTILEKELLDRNTINASLNLKNSELISQVDTLELTIQKLMGEREASKELSAELMGSRDSLKSQLDSQIDIMNKYKDKLITMLERQEWNITDFVNEIQVGSTLVEGESDYGRLLFFLVILLTASKCPKHSNLYNQVTEMMRIFLSRENDFEGFINSLQNLNLVSDENDDEKLSVEDLEDLFAKEISEMEKSILAASETMNKLLLEARSKYSGDKLEYNTQILDSCSSLVEAVRNLISGSKELQNEITLLNGCEGKEYYKKNHRWTQGLISAARAVGAGANFLMTSADEVARRDFNAKFESLIAASQEVAASTAQIVIASKVKADPKSENLKKLTARSKIVTEATARVIAVCRTTSQIREDEKDLDFSSLTPHQTKLLEMETQVKVLELESDLEKERKKLFEFRKLHYNSSD